MIEQTYDNIELIVVDHHSPTDISEPLSDLATDELTNSEFVRHEETVSGRRRVRWESSEPAERENQYHSCD